MATGDDNNADDSDGAMGDEVEDDGNGATRVYDDNDDDGDNVNDDNGATKG